MEERRGQEGMMFSHFAILSLLRKIGEVKKAA
jgi:hypothetical protein